MYFPPSKALTLEELKEDLKPDGRRKLTEDDEGTIRLAMAKGAKAKDLAAKYGVHTNTILRIVRGRR